jgi:hypothetical protein
MYLTVTKVEQVVREMEAIADEMVFSRLSPEERGRMSGRMVILAGELRTEIARQELRVVHLTGAMQ